MSKNLNIDINISNIKNNPSLGNKKNRNTKVPNDIVEKINSGNNNNNNKNNKKFSAWKFFRNSIIVLFILGIFVGLCGVGYIFAVIKSSPPLDVNAVLTLNQPSMLFDNKGEFIDNLPTLEERYVISYEKMPKNLINAFIAIEDERFRQHNGIDIRRIAGALIGDVRYILTGKGMPQGASTLTQQLLKNTILFSEASQEQHYFDSVNRKIKEIYLAIQLENKLSKDQIIEAYLNTIPLGGYLYGVEAASQYFFNKPAEKLNLIECAYLAGITQMPSYYSAYNVEEEGYPNTYLDRTKIVLQKMLELNFISKQEYDIAFADVTANNFAFQSQNKDYRVNYEWYVYPTLQQVRADLKSIYNYTDEEVNNLFVNGGLKIYTSMDRKMQDSVQEVIDNRDNFDVSLNLDKLIEEYSLTLHDDGSVTDAVGNLLIDDINAEGEYTRNGIPFLQGAATVMNYKTGEVVALIGGRGTQPAHSLNRAYDSLRPIASTTKPITVYGPAIDTQIITAASPIDDAPIDVSITEKYAKNWDLNNYNFKFDGFITSREAIAFSKNITSVRLVDTMGLNTALDYGKKAGIIYNDVSATSMSALALGQHDNENGSDGGNTTILASAFGSFGNNGVRTEPMLYTKIVDSKGKVIIDKKPNTVKLFSPETAHIMYDILKEPVKRFDASGAQFGEMPVSGKTGTTDRVDNFWFAGLTPYYSASVWIGYDSPLRMDGLSSAAASLWGSVMKPVHEGLEVKEIDPLEAPLPTAHICMDSGKLATDICEHDQRGGRTRKEQFIPGTEPTSYCDVHVRVSVNASNNKLVSQFTPYNLISNRVFIKKPYADPKAADYYFVVPTQYDNGSTSTTKPPTEDYDDSSPTEDYDDSSSVPTISPSTGQTISLFTLGLTYNMDLYNAISILNSNGIKYQFTGVPVGNLEPNVYRVTSFTPEINKGGTATLNIEKIYDTGVGDVLPPTTQEPNPVPPTTSPEPDPVPPTTPPAPDPVPPITPEPEPVPPITPEPEPVPPITPEPEPVPPTTPPAPEPVPPTTPPAIPDPTPPSTLNPEPQSRSQRTISDYDNIDMEIYDTPSQS